MGRLQRGLGSGAREVLARPPSESAELIHACLARDPRCDSQLDSRADYYARLALSVAIDVGVIEGFVIEAERGAQRLADVPIGLRVLIRMAALGSSEALAAVHRYVASGRCCTEAIDLLVSDPWDFEPAVNWRERVDGLAEVVCSRYPTVATLSDALDDEWTVDADRPPWSDWASEHQLVGDAFDVVGRRAVVPQPSADLQECSTADLLARQGDAREHRSVARILSRRTSDVDVALMRCAVDDPSMPMGWGRLVLCLVSPLAVMRR